MKRITHLLSWALLVTMIVTGSCSKGGSGGSGNPPPPPPPPPGQTLKVEPSKTTMFSDGWEEITFVVKDQNNQVVPTVQLYVNNVAHNRSTF